MVSNSFFGRLRHFGYLMFSYTLAKSLGLTTAVVLERILTEYQFSLSNYLNVKGWFIINYAEIGFHLGLIVEDVEEAVEELASLNLIELTEYGGLLMAKVYEEELVNFVQIAEIDNNYKMWNYALTPIQKQILNLEDI